MPVSKEDEEEGQSIRTILGKQAGQTLKKKKKKRKKRKVDG
jgi:hypothetical protein